MMIIDSSPMDVNSEDIMIIPSLGLLEALPSELLAYTIENLDLQDLLRCRQASDVMLFAPQTEIHKYPYVIGMQDIPIHRGRPLRHSIQD